MRESVGQPDLGIRSDRKGSDSVLMGTAGSVTIIDKFTGEARNGGPELLGEMHANLVRERERFLSSKNPCYLVGRVRQNEAAFDAGEVKRMVDATFECASLDSPDAWYPNQYALSLAHASPEEAGIEVAHFLSNFELGLRTSGDRATRQLGQGDWLRESRQLAARLENPFALGGLTGENYRSITAHVAGHPRLAEAMSWYEKGSGKKMHSGEDVGAKDPALTEAQAHAFLRAAGMTVLTARRDEVARMDISAPLRNLRELTSDAATVAAQKGRLCLVFPGWEADPRELYEIEEVRTYFAALDREFPYWLWFLNQGQIVISLLLLCPPCKARTDGRVAHSLVDGASIRDWLRRHIDALADLKEKHGLSAAEVNAVARGVCDMLAGAVKGGQQC